MNKIKQIANLIKKCNCVWDVGSDHALLAITLLKNKTTKLVVNIEKNIKPLQSGKNNLARNHLASKTLNVLNDGLKNISKKIIDKPNYIVISGMGGLNIIDILKNRDKDINIANPIFILSANTDIVLLREWLMKNGMVITNEFICYDRNKFYPIIITKIGKGKYKLSLFELYFGTHLIQVDDEIKQKYINFVKSNIEKNKSNLKNKEFKELYVKIKQYEKANKN